jgi:hypothetical protein
MRKFSICTLVVPFLLFAMPASALTLSGRDIYPDPDRGGASAGERGSPEGPSGGGKDNASEHNGKGGNDGKGGKDRDGGKNSDKGKGRK